MGANLRVGRITTLDELPEPHNARTLEPEKPAKPCVLPIVAVRPDRTVVCEEGVLPSPTARMAFFHEYVELLPSLPRHIVVTFSSDSWLWQLDERYKDHPRWTWSVMVQEKPHRKLRQHVSYYGFRPPKGERKGAFSHLVIDAGSFTQDMDTDLLELGQWVREFCNEHGLKMRASAAGIAAQMLRHPMFYPDARRAVPRFINAKARKHLPGPFYESYVDSVQRIEAATYIDQEAAYHYAAETTPLPNANSIRAIGNTRTNAPYARAGSELFEREMRKHGLIHAMVVMPRLRPEQEKFVPRPLRRTGRFRVWLWTNEVPYLKSLGMEIEYLISVWGTQEVDKGIRAYAKWARETGKGKPHLKALLLMPYGALGRRPATITMHTPGGKVENEFPMLQGSEDTDGDLLLAGQFIEGTRTRTVKVQTYTSNALQLGLIQAHVRALSLDMARQLAAHGQEVISVYADGIFIRLDESGQLPMFAPWRLKEEDLQLHLSDSLRVPVRAKVRREYISLER